MSNTITIKIMDVEVHQGTTKTKKPYEFLEVAYKNLSFQDKPEVKKVMPFAYKEVMDVLKGAVKGDVFTVTRDKNDGGFWDWISIQQGEQEVATPTAGAKPVSAQPSKGTWETPEERATKQLYIIRQSCLAQAVNTAAIGAKPGVVIDTKALLDLAQVYVDFIVGVGANTTDDVDEDIPY